MGESAREMRSHRDLLVQLDAAIGDGDHGINMTRGFDAVVAALDGDPAQPPGRLLILCGRTLISAVGGASGPLWGSALRNAGRSLGDAAEFDAGALLAALQAALAAIVDLGAAVVGDKTMVDALDPAIAALRAGLAAGQSVEEALAGAVAAAEEGMRSTVPLQARKGRASYLGERSIGHQDPGATSAALILAALQRTVAGAV
ncbi:MAG TPA: dihydroxyacetone kinase subunit DhaL [Candidatus Dormibacteraeota bacterium]